MNNLTKIGDLSEHIIFHSKYSKENVCKLISVT